MGVGGDGVVGVSSLQTILKYQPVEFEIILEKYRFPKRKVAAKTDLKAVENKFNLQFPDDYCSYLLNYCGFETSIGGQYVELWDIDDLIKNNERIFLQDYLPEAFGIGSNAGGELIAFGNIGNGDFDIILTPFIGMDSPVDIGGSFTDFLMRLDNGRGWFD
jgi:hypothetical protein